MSFIQNNFETVLREFFKSYKPQHMDKVPDFVEEFKGQEVFCIQSLCKRYFVDYNKFIKKFDAEIEAMPEQERIVLEKFKEPKSIEGGSSDKTHEDGEFEGEESSEAPKKKSKLPLIIIIIIVLGGAGAFFFMGGGDDAAAPAQEENNTEISDSTETNLEKAELVEEAKAEEPLENNEPEVSEEASDSLATEEAQAEEADTTAAE